MNPSAPFIARPVTTTLLTIAVALTGFYAFMKLPVAPLPQVDYPTIALTSGIHDKSAVALTIPDLMNALSATRTLGGMRKIPPETDRLVPEPPDPVSRGVSVAADGCSRL
jgi:hypothetical protein